MVARHWLYFGGFVVTAILLIGAALMGLLDALSVLSGDVPSGEEFLLLTMLGEAAEWVMAVLVLGLIALLFLAATAVSILRNSSLHRSDRLVSIVEWLEREYPILRQFDVSRRVEPTTEDRKREVKERYIEGELGEAEFEREMERLLDGDSTDGDTASRSESYTDIEVNDR